MNQEPNPRGFASDNNAGVHPDIMAAMASVNCGHAVAYGDDPVTHAAVGRFKEHFGHGIDVYFVYNGTGANVIGLKSITEPFHSVICADTAHIHVDECGAPERFTGCKLLSVPTGDGKLSVESVRQHVHGFGFVHHAQPRVISITQATELGTVYRPEEIAALADYTHKNSMLLHMDGARLANAADCLGMTLGAITRDVGVDVLSFGGTKNGMMFGEAVVFFNPNHSVHTRYFRKQGMQLASKMRFVSAQFDALLSGDLWLENAAHANRMARLLAEEVETIPSIRITRKVQTNVVFARVPREQIPVLQKERFFYVWNDAASEVRWMTSFDTTPEDIHAFVKFIKATLGS